MQKRPLTRSTSLHGKSPEETRNGRNIPQQNKGYVRQTYSQHYTKWENTESISSKIWNEFKVFTFSISIQCGVLSLSWSSKDERMM